MKKDLSKFLEFKPYKPAKGEKYMESKQIMHFKVILVKWKELLVKEADKTMAHMKNDSTKLADPNDAATQEEEFRLELRLDNLLEIGLEIRLEIRLEFRLDI